MPAVRRHPPIGASFGADVPKRNLRFVPGRKQRRFFITCISLVVLFHHFPPVGAVRFQNRVDWGALIVYIHSTLGHGGPRGASTDLRLQNLHPLVSSFFPVEF